MPVSERDLATTVGALFNPLGNALGQVIPPFVVTVATSGDDDDIDASDVRGGMQRLLIGQCLALCLSFTWCFTAFKAHPPTPPSRSTADRLAATAKAKAQRRADARSSTGGGNGGLIDEEHKAGQPRQEGADVAEDPARVIADLLAQFRLLLRDGNFILLLCAFSIGLGVFNALLTVINQFLHPYGFSNE